MSGNVGYVKDLRGKLHLSEPPLHRPLPNRAKRECLLTQELFESIQDYTRSQPTAPSPGRVYKKDLHWTGPPSNWFIYICVRDPLDPKGTYHIPYSVVLSDA